jgi:hypothetical protein
MGIIHPLPCAGSLDPVDIRIAVAAYETALRWLGRVADQNSVRDTLAKYIIRRCLMGERDAHRLCEGALTYVAVAMNWRGQGEMTLPATIQRTRKSVGLPRQRPAPVAA